MKHESNLGLAILRCSALFVFIAFLCFWWHRYKYSTPKDSPSQKESVKEKSIYDLELGESIKNGWHPRWTRVPGGWMIQTSSGAVFIPYNEDFKAKSTPNRESNDR